MKEKINIYSFVVVFLYQLFVSGRIKLVLAEDIYFSSSTDLQFILVVDLYTKGKHEMCSL